MGQIFKLGLHLFTASNMVQKWKQQGQKGVCIDGYPRLKQSLSDRPLIEPRISQMSIGGYRRPFITTMVKSGIRWEKGENTQILD